MATTFWKNLKIGKESENEKKENREKGSVCQFKKRHTRLASQTGFPFRPGTMAGRGLPYWGKTEPASPLPPKA
jgi:hypothetical protein